MAERLEQVLDTPSKERKYENVQEYRRLVLSVTQAAINATYITL